MTVTKDQLPSSITVSQVRQIAALADVCQATAMKYLSGAPVRYLRPEARRVLSACARLGIPAPALTFVPIAEPVRRVVAEAEPVVVEQPVSRAISSIGAGFR